MNKLIKYKKAYDLLQELWFGVSLSDATFDNIDCGLADDITAIYNNEDKLQEDRQRDLVHYALIRLIEDTHEDSEYKEEEIVEIIDSLFEQEKTNEKKFRVWATYVSSCYLDIEADNKDEAYEIACNEDGGNFIPEDSYDCGSWEVNDYDIEELTQEKI